MHVAAGAAKDDIDNGALQGEDAVVRSVLSAPVPSQHQESLMLSQLVGQFLQSTDGGDLLKGLQAQGLSPQQATQAVHATAEGAAEQTTSGGFDLGALAGGGGLAGALGGLLGAQPGAGAGASGLGAMLGGLMGGAPGASGATPGASGTTPGASGATPGASGLGEALGALMGGASGATPGASGATPGASGLGAMLGGMMGGAPGASGATPGAMLGGMMGGGAAPGAGAGPLAGFIAPVSQFVAQKTGLAPAMAQMVVTAALPKLLSMLGGGAAASAPAPTSAQPATPTAGGAMDLLGSLLK